MRRGGKKNKVCFSVAFYPRLFIRQWGWLDKGHGGRGRRLADSSRLMFVNNNLSGFQVSLILSHQAGLREGCSVAPSHMRRRRSHGNRYFPFLVPRSITTCHLLLKAAFFLKESAFRPCTQWQRQWDWSLIDWSPFDREPSSPYPSSSWRRGRKKNDLRISKRGLTFNF